MNDVLAARIQDSDKLNRLCQPVFYRRTSPEDAAQLSTLLSNNPQLTVFDSMRSQLEELIKTRNPKRKLSQTELVEQVLAHLNGISESDYGVWVYYPWSNRLVHTLEEAEFAELRTNRNVYKITVDEQSVLAHRKIGIIGLSVGQSVALTLAMERGFGELRIADFDAIELSNLNRIRAGIHNIGTPKVIAVAREIAEIDPYLHVKCFADGLTEGNLDAFFLGDGPLDLVIDECDGLDVKILARQRARALKIPVLMETSDRGMLDVERFDLEPDRPILHGLVEHLDTANLKGLSNEEKVPYILSMIGLDTMSDRMKASFLEVEQTISTWPQLASDVVLGGATTANISRRIALDQMHVSGRFFVDIDAIVSDDSPDASRLSKSSAAPEQPATDPFDPSPRPEAKLNVYEGQAELDQAMVVRLVEAAAMAPSGGNVQPWRWIYREKNLYLYVDPARSHSYLDFEQTGAYLSLGAAAENLVLKSHEFGLEVALDIFPSSADPDLVAVSHFFKKDNRGGHPVEPHVCDSLVASIPHRLTNRNIERRTQMPAAHFDQLRDAAQSIAGIQFDLTTDEQHLHEIGEIIASADRLLLTDKEGHHGFVSEIRWTAAEARRMRDGVDIATIDLSPAEVGGLNIARSWTVVKHLAKWGGGSVFEKLSRKCMAAASAVGLLTMPEYSPAGYFNGGRAVQRMWLQAHQLGICLQPMSALVFLFSRWLHGGASEMSPAMRDELADLRQQYERLFNPAEQRQDIFLFRLFEAGPPKVRALRRPVEDILTIE